MIKMSIVVPVYNAEVYLRDCLDSLANQTLSDIEFWLIDDGSIDNSLEICKAYAQKDGRFKVYSQKNVGAGVARDVGISKCNGEYIGFLDSDDWVESHTYEKMYCAAKTNDADIVRCNTIIHKAGRLEKRWDPPFCNQVLDNNRIVGKVIPLLIAPEEEQNFNERLLRGCVCNIFRKKLILENDIHFTRLKSGEDVLFTIEAMMRAKTMIILSEAFYHYMFYNNDSLSKSINSIDRKQRSDLRQQMQNLLKTSICYEELQKRWKQEDRRLIYLDIRIIVVYSKGMSKKDRIDRLKELLNSQECRDAFKEKVDPKLPFQMYALYSLIKMKLYRVLFYVVRLKFREEV